MRYLPLLLEIALLVFALVECLQSDDDERAGLPLAIWIVLIVIIPVAGPIAWLVVSRTQRSASQGQTSWGPAVPAGPRAPDDDPEFLWRLEAERRRSTAATAAATGAPPGPAPKETGPTAPGATEPPTDDAGRDDAEGTEPTR